MQRCRREEWRGAGWVSACSTRSASCPSRWPPRAGWRSRSPAQLAGLRRARRAQLAAHAAAPYQRRVRLGSAELREDEGCGGHEQEELGHRDPLLTAVLHLRVLRAPDQRAISDDGRELTAQSFCLCVAEQEGGTDVVAPALLEVDGLLRPPGLRLLLRQAQPTSPSAQPRGGEPARAGAIAEARTMRCGRCSWFGKVVSGRSGEAGRPRRGPKPIGHSSSRQIAFCPRRSAWQPVRARREEPDKKRDGSVR